MKLAESYITLLYLPEWAVIGPLVIAGVSVFEEDVEKLKEIKVKDSKELSSRQRSMLYKQIEAIAKDIIVLKIAPCKIDTMKKEGVNLNKLEALKMGEILDYLNGDAAYVDSPDVIPDRLKRFLHTMVKSDKMEIVAEHKADSTYPIVSAASIIAKVERDREIEEIKKKYGDVGPGYPANETTMAWMRQWLKTHKEFPDIVRKSWATTSNVHGENKQSKLASWLTGRKKEDCQ